MQKYTYKAYDPIYPKLFLIEKEKIEQLLPFSTTIAHVGSTAVPNLGGKGILDVMIGVTEGKMEEAKEILAQAYDFRPLWSTPERLYFKKNYFHEGVERVVHIHLTQKGSREWKRFVGFRDYLIAHPKALASYIAIKKEAVKMAEGEGEKYRAYKKNFINEITKKAEKSPH